MNKKDQQFFDKHWKEWVRRNPPPTYWPGSVKEWAELEMPCYGFLGKFIFWLTYFG